MKQDKILAEARLWRCCADPGWVVVSGGERWCWKWLGVAPGLSGNQCRLGGREIGDGSVFHLDVLQLWPAIVPWNISM